MEHSGPFATSDPRPLPRIRGRHSRPPGAVVYGPLRSRRLGRSLGLNLAQPGSTTCSFHCVYCEYPREHCDYPFGDWPTPLGVARALKSALSRCGPLDSITISGSGEPTLHPEFPAVVDQILSEARRARPGVPVRILTNGETTPSETVRGALDRLDECIVMLDACAERIGRPGPGAPLGSIVYAISLLRDVTLQSCFVGGDVSNTDDASVREWADLVEEVQPRSVQIFTISRPPATADARPVPRKRLEEIAEELHERTGIEARVFV